MRRILLCAIFCLGFSTIAAAQIGITFFPGPGNPATSGGGGCSQATTFLARTSGLSGTETTAYTNMICGMVSDGTWSLLDVLYIYATNTSTTANLNLVSTSYTGTVNGTACTFTADQGYTGNNPCWIVSGFNPSTAGGNYTQNSASFGAYVLTSRTALDQYVEWSCYDATVSSYIIPHWSDGNSYLAVNETGSTTNATTNAQGFWINTRTAANAEAQYKNGASLFTATNSSTQNCNSNFIAMAFNASSPADFSSDQVSAVFAGGGLTSTQAGQISARINGYMTALGINVY